GRGGLPRAPYGDRLEWTGLAEPDVAGPSELEQGEEGHRLLDSRQPLDLLVEVETATPRQHGAEALEEPLDRGKCENEVPERRLRRWDRKRADRAGEARRILPGELAGGGGRGRGGGG